MNKQTIDYVFKAKSDNSLEFIGDFESLYKNEEDPWDQSGKGATGNYYKISRDRLNEKLTELKFNSLTEIGCGLGYTTNYIKKSLPDSNVTGIDISHTAISKAKQFFPDLNFKQANVCSEDFLDHVKPMSTDILILNQLLWYILEDLDVCMTNCYHSLKEGGSLIFSQALLKEKQRYGREIINGYDGLVNYLNNEACDLFTLQSKNLYQSKDTAFNDALIVLTKNPIR